MCSPPNDKLTPPPPPPPPPPGGPYLGIPHTPPSEPARKKSSFLNGLIHAGGIEIENYINLADSYDRIGQKCILRAAFFMSVLDNCEGTFKIVSRAMRFIPPQATLRLWMQVDGAQKIVARAEAEEIGSGIHRCNFTAKPLDYVAANRQFYDQIPEFPPGPLTPGMKWSITAKWKATSYLNVLDESHRKIAEQLDRNSDDSWNEVSLLLTL